MSFYDIHFYASSDAVRDIPSGEKYPGLVRCGECESIYLNEKLIDKVAAEIKKQERTNLEVFGGKFDRRIRVFQNSAETVTRGSLREIVNPVVKGCGLTFAIDD